jgi:hypothetical protein
MDLTGPTPRCYVPRLLMSTQMENFIFLDLRKVAVHKEMHVWPSRITSYWRYAICPPPVAAPYLTYTCKLLTDAKLFHVVGFRAARHQRRVPVKVRVGCLWANGTFSLILREDYKSVCVRVLPHLFECKTVRLTSERVGCDTWGIGYQSCIFRWTQYAPAGVHASVRCFFPLL